MLIGGLSTKLIGELLLAFGSLNDGKRVIAGINLQVPACLADQRGATLISN